MRIDFIGSVMQQPFRLDANWLDKPRTPNATLVSTSFAHGSPVQARAPFKRLSLAHSLTTVLNWMQPRDSATSTTSTTANNTSKPIAPVDGRGDPGGTYKSEARRPFRPVGFNDAQRGQAAIERTLADTAMASQIQNDEFEVIQHDNGNYTLVLPGVIDLSKPHWGLDSHSQSVRDIDQTALSSSVNARVASNPYAMMVRDYVLDPSNNIPRGANVMLVGHSLGGDTALDLAADPTFNNAKTGVNITHVVSAAYFNQPELDQVPSSTQVLVLQNARDIPVIAEGLGYTATEARNAAGRVMDGGINTAEDVWGMGSAILQGDLGGAWQEGGDLAGRAQRALTPDALPMPDAASLLQTGVRKVDGHIVEARFNGGSEGAGHHQQNYIDYVNGAGKNDPAVSEFFASLSEAGYAAPGQTKAVDVSVSDPAYKTTYPGDDVVEAVVEGGESFWDRVPGSGLVEDVVGGGVELMGDAASFAWDNRSVVGDARDVVRDGVVGLWNNIPGNDGVESVIGDAADHLPFNNAVSAGFNALAGQNNIRLDADATQAIQRDEGFLATEQTIVNSIKQRDGYGERAMSIPLADLDVNLVVELGGKRGAGSMKDQLLHAYDFSDPEVAQTWGVAANELSWLLRHATLGGTANVAKDGSISIDYTIRDQLDLRPSQGRSDEYNLASSVLGTLWHDVLGAEVAQVTGAFTHTAQPAPGKAMTPSTAPQRTPTAADRVTTVSLQEDAGVPYSPDFKATPNFIRHPANGGDPVGRAAAFEKHAGKELARGLGLNVSVDALYREKSRLPKDSNAVEPQLLHEPKINAGGGGSGTKDSGGVGEPFRRPDWVIVQKDQAVLAVEATLDSNFQIKDRDGANHKALQLEGTIAALVQKFGEDRSIHYVIRSPSKPGQDAQSVMQNVERLLRKPEYANVHVTWVAG
jgi:hypothetical protein